MTSHPPGTDGVPTPAPAPSATAPGDPAPPTSAPAPAPATEAADDIARPVPATDAAITLRAALRLPVLARGLPQVLSGRDRLDRPIRWVHAGEVPNIAAVLKGGELLLTTGMGIRRSRAEHRAFVDQLAARGVAAVAIELGTTFAEIPDTLVAPAERAGLPIIALHRELAFVEVTEALHREIVDRQALLMRRGEALHRRFTELMLAGAGIPEVLGALAETVANPVVLERSGEGILYHATHHADAATVIAAWEAHRRGLEESYEAIEHPIPMAGRAGAGILTSLAIDSPLTDFDRIAVERAVGLIALSLARDHEAELLASRGRGTFFTRLLARELDEREAGAQATAHGFARSSAAMLPCAAIRAPAPGAPRNRSGEERPLGTAGGGAREPRDDQRSAPVATVRSEEPIWALVWRDVKRELDGRGVPFIVGTRGAGAEMLAVLSLDRATARAALADRFAELVTAACARHFGTPDAAVIAIGPVAGSWSAAQDGLREAVEAVWAAAHTPPRPWHDATEPSLDRLLWTLRDQPALGTFVRQRLAVLRAYDARHDTALIPTLAAFCAHAGRKGDAARALHVTRQTLYARLGRIAALLELDLSDGDALLALHLALRAEPYAARP